jgi:thiamine biosynthesis lipoprotein
MSFTCRLFGWLIGCFLSACSQQPPLIKLEGFTQGTTYHITYVGETASQSLIQTQVNDELARIDAALSNYRDDSALEHFNAALGTDVTQVEAELVQLVELARRVQKGSDGCYDLTIKPLFDLWGFKKETFTPPDAATLEQTLAQVGMDKLETVDGSHLRKRIPGLRIDVSSIGQGYSVGRLAEILEQAGVENYLVEIGGELQVRGKKPDGSPWRIALEKPLPNERKLHKIVSFDDGQTRALMASGTYRHYFDRDGKRYSHILDARSGKPIEHSTVSVTVIHPDPTLADAWSTALLCLGSEAGLFAANQNQIAALFIDQQGDELPEQASRAWTELKGVSFPKK